MLPFTLNMNLSPYSTTTDPTEVMTPWEAQRIARRKETARTKLFDAVFIGSAIISMVLALIYTWH